MGAGTRVVVATQKSRLAFFKSHSTVASFSSSASVRDITNKDEWEQAYRYEIPGFFSILRH
ncbi:hypothetical protein RJ641_031934 [Dillenia turbinata]|uniref:Uncharacterized protein n=1 Tax=Dillenia turbinata TaxID=194707 RepID=A0AAN8VZ29_9MAGN